MEKNRQKIAFVLSGGGSRGIAHMGIIQALNEHNIYPDYISAVSSGALFGALYADGYNPKEVLEIFANSKSKYFDLAFPKQGLLKMSKLIRLLKNNLKSTSFDTLKIPMYIAATDIINAKIVYFSSGNLLRIIVASSSVPVLFSPVKIDGTTYVDGGVLNNLPINPIKSLADVIIGMHANPLSKETEFKTLASIAERSFHLSIGKNVKYKSKECDLFFEPPKLTKYKVLETSKERLNEIFDIGYEFTMNKIEKDKKFANLIIKLSRGREFKTPNIKI